ncbi:protein LNK2-like isoform X2 [Diospyros lotus]|uniref:protein LNK2-like isoform X2 n=1 Tax=Diospyros lotus TaxID=55363 RepID=UPI0022548AAB|nr:protein LNK2-like isoform X2 [Diospyros lotus]
MFDWNEQELANIVWDEAGDSDDHIVPYPGGCLKKPPGLYPDHTENECNQESANAKPAELRKNVTKSDHLGGKQETSSQYDTGGTCAGGHSNDSRSNLSQTAKTDQAPIGNQVSTKLNEIAKIHSLRDDERSQLDNCSEIFQNHHDDKEPSNFDDYAWANIGSFEDLDRIFSNDDPIFGHASLENTDQLWSSSKDITSSPEKSFSLSVDSPSSDLGAFGSMHEHFKVKTECMQDEDQSFTHSCLRMSHLTSHPVQNVHPYADQVDNAGLRSKPIEKEKISLEMPADCLMVNSHFITENIPSLSEVTDKVNNQEKILKTWVKSEEGCEGQQLQVSSGTGSPCGSHLQQYGQITSSVLSHQMQLQRPASSLYQYSRNLLMSPSGYGSVQNQHSTMATSPQMQSGEDNQSVLSGYEVSMSSPDSLSRSPGSSIEPLRMTPQEKIEKLRRRQQTRALLAIQKQHQQFSHNISSKDHFVVQNSPHENDIQLIKGGNVDENASSPPSFDPNSPIEHDDSNRISMTVDDGCSIKDAILHHLQHIIAKLDIQIRLCIRDSLFRLAQSSMQRQHPSDTSSTNTNLRAEHEFVTKKETASHNRSLSLSTEDEYPSPNLSMGLQQHRFTGMADGETKTNSIDRTVAHLLFHRPLEFSGNYPETLESPASVNLQYKRNTTGLLSSPRGLFPDNYECKQEQDDLFCDGSKDPQLFAEGSQSKNSPCIENSEITSTNEAADRGGGGLEIETSQ